MIKWNEMEVEKKLNKSKKEFLRPEEEISSSP
jgi:hypothetical protein